MISTYAWVLPRPPASRYPGGFPLYFEQRLLDLLGNPARILHPFGGMSEIGLRCDLRSTHPRARDADGVREWHPPDVLADAHALPFASDVFNCVICDPPYSAEESAQLYGTPAPVYARFIAEAVRVTVPGGFVCSYNKTLTPRPAGTFYYARILIATRVWHQLRACCIFRKYTTAEAAWNTVLARTGIAQEVHDDDGGRTGTDADGDS